MTHWVTIITEIAVLLIVIGVLWRYVVPPMRRAVRERQQTVRRQIQEAEQARERLEAAEAKHRDALAEARTEAAQIRESARADAQRIREELRSQAEDEVVRIRQRGEDQLASQRDQIARALRIEVGTLAVTLAERLVTESLQDETRRRETVDRFIDELEHMTSREGS